MTDQQLIIAVAKLDGWTNPKCDADNTNTCYGTPPLDNPPPKERNWLFKEYLCCELPHYLVSRDAIIPVIEKVCNTKELKEEFVCCLTLELDDTEHFSLLDVFSAITKTTPKQLAIALVKACGNWEE